MKKFLNLTFILCAIGLSLAGCTKQTISINTNTSSNEPVEATLYSSYSEGYSDIARSIHFRISNPRYDQYIKKENVVIKFSDDEFEFFSYSGKKQDSYYSWLLIPKKIGKFTVEVNYFEQNWKLDFDIKDVNKDKIKTINSLDELTRFKEFQDLIKGIKRHNFKEPYIGINGYGGSDYWDTASFTKNFNDTNYTLDYVDYLLDDAYYPSYLPMLEKSSIVNRAFSMSFDSKADITTAAKRTRMQDYRVGCSEIDPDCTNPQDPISGVYFEAISKEAVSSSPIYKNQSLDSNYSYIRNLRKIYPELFYDYKLNDDLTINILYYPTIGKINAIFEDDSYNYDVSIVYALERL